MATPRKRKTLDRIFGRTVAITAVGGSVLFAGGAATAENAPGSEVYYWSIQTP
jgi:hypothetical protein